MSSKMKIIIVSVLLLTVMSAGLLFVVFSPTVVFIAYFGVITPFQESWRQERLLCRTDHQALLDSCRALSNHVSVSYPEAAQGKVYMRVPDSELSEFPLIRRLGGRVFFVNGVVSIEFGGTMRHLGVKAYPEDYKEPFSNYDHGDKELVPGLWYYDDTFNRQEDYGEKIDRMLRRGQDKQGRADVAMTMCRPIG